MLFPPANVVPVSENLLKLDFGVKSANFEKFLKKDFHTILNIKAMTTTYREVAFKESVTFSFGELSHFYSVDI